MQKGMKKKETPSRRGVEWLFVSQENPAQTTPGIIVVYKMQETEKEEKKSKALRVRNMRHKQNHAEPQGVRDEGTWKT